MVRLKKYCDTCECTQCEPTVLAEYISYKSGTCTNCIPECPIYTIDVANSTFTANAGDILLWIWNYSSSDVFSASQTIYYDTFGEDGEIEIESFSSDCHCQSFSLTFAIGCVTERNDSGNMIKCSSPIGNLCVTYFDLSPLIICENE